MLILRQLSFFSNKYIIRICRKPILQQYSLFYFIQCVLPNKHHLLLFIKKPINSLFPRETINTLRGLGRSSDLFRLFILPVFYKNQWNNSKKPFGETHSSGSVADLHGIPF